MSADEAFIRDILAHPDDLGLRLIYADWLDEHDDPRGIFLRAEAEYLALPEKDERRDTLRRQLREMSYGLDPRWRTRLDLPLIENCAIEFSFICPKRWQDLAETDQTSVRFCERCEKSVYHCDSTRDAREHAWQGHCVAVDTRQERYPGDLEPSSGTTMGILLDPEEDAPDRILRSRGEYVTILDGPYRGRRGLILRLHNTSRRTSTHEATVRLVIDNMVVRLSLSQLKPD